MLITVVLSYHDAEALRCFIRVHHYIRLKSRMIITRQTVIIVPMEIVARKLVHIRNHGSSSLSGVSFVEFHLWPTGLKRRKPGLSATGETIEFAGQSIGPRSIFQWIFCKALFPARLGLLSFAAP
jgi:hypothetical protein